MWFGSANNLAKLTPSDMRLQVGDDVIVPVTAVRNLGVMFDSHLTMQAHVAKTAQACFFHLRRLRAVRNKVGQSVMIRLVCVFVLSRLDYCNAVLAGLPDATLAPLQRVLNAAARLVSNLSPRDHVTPALRQLHWLPIRQRIDFKLCVIVHQAVTGRAPSYLRSLLTFVADRPGRVSLRSASRRDLDVPRTRLKFGERAFSVAAPLVWNRLPSDIRDISSTPLFKKKLKTYLFSVAYP